MLTKQGLFCAPAPDNPMKAAGKNYITAEDNGMQAESKKVLGIAAPAADDPCYTFFVSAIKYVANEKGRRAE
ncbi:hypothetical protein QW71_30540 [Paenibacillus sp. IHB B 3415]|uniref:hypothetical protein n=1 Tax=Paenibacillus sp. IHB B 3415 TaxID=867080 RepID=UPI0005742F3F|nr:hypothetical protein [Paenibacillus sp. IHB B 3415]KHL92209.1 hypothetical protein QW71_30540 [Paenibacillus sp. IHB B 3415]